MSSGLGYPDWQQIQQWLGAPVASQSAYPIGAGPKVEGPFNLASWASVIVAVKPTGGTITLTVSQTIAGGPPGLVLAEQFVIPAGQTAFEAIVLYGDAVTVTLQGSIAGETVDYAIYPSNTTTNAQVLASATINVQKAGVLIGAEPTVNFLDGLGIKITPVDDGGNTRVGITIAQAAIADLILAASAASVDIQNIPATFAHLLLLCSLRGDAVTSGNSMLLQFNGDAGANYEHGEVFGSSAGAGGAATFADTKIFYPIQFHGSTAPAGQFLGSVATILDYASAVKNKVVTGSNFGRYADSPGNISPVSGGGSWASLAAINRATLTPTSGNVIAGSRVTLEGRAGT